MMLRHVSYAYIPCTLLLACSLLFPAKSWAAEERALTTATEKKTSTVTNELTEKQLDSLMKRARADLSKKNYASAIRYLTALISADNHKYSREALEFLGLARQRKGQKTHAVTIYKKYLGLYPEGAASDRVRQRLTGLLTASSAPRKKIRMSADKKINDIESYGSLAQFYRNNKTSVDELGNITTQSQLITFLDLTTLHRTENFDHRYQFTSDHSYDFIDDEDNSEFRFSEAFYELSDTKTSTSAKLGRQSQRIAGYRKRFDGVSAGYQLSPEMRINFLAGLPVDITDKSSLNQHKTFYGFSFETGSFLKHWDMNLFYFDQKNDGLQDRTNTGTEVRYRNKGTSLFGMIDYDLFFKEVNIIQLNTNFLFNNGRSIYINAIKRQSPMLATSNALIGRQETTIEELKQVLNIEQIHQLARDNTASSQSFTLGGSHPISENFHATTDITFSQVDNAAALVDTSLTDTKTDYFLSAQLVGNNLLQQRDTTIFSIRYYDTAASQTTSFILNSRYPITKNWRINPRLQYDIRNLADSRSQKKLRAALKIDYRHLKDTRFDFEIGYDETTVSDSNQPLLSNNLFMMLGYRWDF